MHKRSLYAWAISGVLYALHLGLFLSIPVKATEEAAPSTPEATSNAQGGNGSCTATSDDASHKDDTLCHSSLEVDYLGVKQNFDPNIISLEDFHEDVERVTEYKKSFEDDPDFAHVHDKCVYRDPNCHMMAVQGKCFDEESPTNAQDFHYMTTHCCPICEFMDDLRTYIDCPIDPDAKTHYTQPGQVSETFVSLLSNLTQLNLEYTVHSAPLGTIPNDLVDYEYKRGPWIVTIEDFVSQQERETLIGHGERLGYELSTDGFMLEDGTTGVGPVPWRSSYETFCYDSQCYDDPIIVSLLDRIYQVLGIPTENSDWLQLLRYRTSQHYDVHQDYHTHQVHMTPGARVVTWYMYLSDVEEGGQTQFPFVDVRVQPKRGRVAVWSNIRDDAPLEEDLLARHQALPVEKGLKYGATAWFHHRNIRDIDPGCTR